MTLEKEFKEFTLKVLKSFQKFIEEYKKNPEIIDKQIAEFKEMRKKRHQLKETNQRINVEDMRTIFEWDPFGEDIELGFLVSHFTIFILSKSTEYKDIENKFSKILPKRFDIKTKYLDYPVENTADYFLKNFYIILLRKMLKVKENFTQELLDEYIQVFFKEINNEPLEVITFNHIIGLTLDIDEIKLNNSLLLKKGTHEDYKSLEKFGYFHKTITIIKPAVLLKQMKETRTHNELLQIEHITFRILRLFRLSSVFPYERYTYWKTTTNASQLLENKYSVSEPLFNFYKIDEKNAPSLKEFFKELYLPMQKITVDEDYRSILIALERFEWSLYDFVGLDRKLMFAVMGLETLFSTDDERAGQKRRLSFRIPKFLGFLGYRKDHAKRAIEEAYIFRNKVVHGLKYKKNWINRTEKLLPKILNYLRVSIIYYLMNLSKTKKEFVKLIDDSFLFEKHEQLLEKQISKSKLKFPSVFAEVIPKPYIKPQFKMIVGKGKKDS